MTLTVALLQMAHHGFDQAANLAKGEEFCRRACSMGADIALFPEMWNIGYSFETPAERAPERGADQPVSTDLWRAPGSWAGSADDQARLTPAVQEVVAGWQARAVPADGEYVAHFRSLARELDMAIGLTYLERWPNAPRNTLSLIDRHGEVALTYAKVHTCDFGLPEAACTPGDGFITCDLDTAEGPLRTGAMICYDREFPESARILMLQGAEIILVPNACDMEINRLSQLRARAYENMTAIAMTNYPGRGWGHSLAFDGIAFGANAWGAAGSRDMLIVEAGEAEGIYLANFDLGALRGYRSREAWGNAFRRPHRYGQLVSAEVQDPFVRVNERGEPYPRECR